MKENRGWTLTPGRYCELEQSCLMNISVLSVYICQSNTPLFVILLCVAIKHKSRQLAALILRLCSLKGVGLCVLVINQPYTGGWADLSFVPGSLPLPLVGSGQSSSGDAGASPGQEACSVCGGECPPWGPQLRRLWV